jgi:hypothetical protein
MMDDFCDRFRNYNEGDMEILNDRNSTDENMDEVFLRFASECHVAVLLVNARFVNPEHYANKYEVPVLIERKKAGVVVLVGVRFSNVSDFDLKEWNAKGDIYFFSLTNNDLPHTRSLNGKSEAFLREFAVYEQVDRQDLNDFHKRLRLWIRECISKKFGNGGLTPLDLAAIPLRAVNETEKKLHDMKPGSLLYKMEKILSEDKAFWDEAGIAVPVERETYAFWYCLQQADKYNDLQTKLLQLTSEDPPIKLGNICEKIERRNSGIRRLIGTECSDDQKLDVQLLECLSSVDSALEKSREKVIAAPRKNHTEAKSDIVNAVEELRNTLKSLCESSVGGS